MHVSHYVLSALDILAGAHLAQHSSSALLLVSTIIPFPDSSFIKRYDNDDDDEGGEEKRKRRGRHDDDDSVLIFIRATLKTSW